jgi:hypothetical protein
LKPAQANVCKTLPQKYPSQQKRSHGVTQVIGPDFKPQYQKKKKERNVKENFSHRSKIVPNGYLILNKGIRSPENGHVNKYINPPPSILQS